MPTTATGQMAVCLALTNAISRSRGVEEIYESALDALADGLGVSRASILLFDPDGVMRFKAYRGLSDAYRCAVEGHTPWTSDSVDAEPFVVSDVGADPDLAPYLSTIKDECIAAMAFIPLISLSKVIGKFMLYFEAPRTLSLDEIQLARVIASQVAFAVERTRAEAQARRSEERLRFALDAALMGTWDWDMAADTVQWSDNLERIHGLAAGTFDGQFGSYEREIHPEDRDRVLQSIRRAIAEGIPHEVEYRIVAPDGTVRWVEGKGIVEYENGRPARMTGVCMIVSRRKEAELARLAEARKISDLKDEFLATLSHELRTPLNAILGWAQMLESGIVAPEHSRQAIDVIGRNARLQARLIEDILDVSRIITGKLEIDRLPVLLPHVIDTVVSGAAPAALAKRIALVKDVPDDLPPIEGDPKRLHQVLGNVLSNAIKFTPDGGRVEIRGAACGEQIELVIRDSGIGIDREFLPYVFDRFRQADSRSTRSHGGLGLGLAIARHLIEQHHGTIRAESEGRGCGTTIAIRLPIGLREALPEPDGRYLHVADDYRLDGMTVLVVDDQHDARELLRTILERCGAEVVACDRAVSARHALAVRRIDVIVADIAMPDVDGYELIRQIRAVDNAIPAIAVSAYARPRDLRDALASGFNGYCAKPIEAQQFLSVVRSVVRA